MSTIITAGGSIQRASGTSLIAKYPMASFFIIMCAGVWVAYLPLLLSQNGLGILPFTIPIPAPLFNLPASLLGPLLAGYMVARATGGREAVKQFRGRLFRWRVSVLWYILPLVGIPVVAMLASVAVLGTSPLSALGGNLTTFAVGYLSLVLIIGLLVNMWEEGGLMGFAQPWLQRGQGALVGSLILGAMWAIMHVPAFLIPEMGVGVGGELTLTNFALGLVVMILFAIPVRIIATWLFNKTGESAVIIAIFHAAMNATQNQFTALVPGYSSIYLIVAFAAIALLLIAITRGRLAYNREPVSTTQGAFHQVKLADDAI